MIKNMIVILLTAAAVYYSVKYPGDIAQSVKESIDRCLNVMIPSMFIFLCITSYISLSGLHSIISFPLSMLSNKLFRLPKEGLAIFLLSLISGYPAGIKLVEEGLLSKRLDPHQAKVMSCFCYCGGPAFINGVTSQYLYPGSNASLIIFISIISANILTAIILTRKLNKPTLTFEKPIISKGSLIPSVRSASSAMLGMCTMITAFGGVICILDLSGAIDMISSFISLLGIAEKDTAVSFIMSFLEISNIVNFHPTEPYLFPAAAFLLSFGGVCVIMQIALIGKNCLNLNLFIAARLFAALCSSAISSILIRVLDIDTACTAANISVYHRENSPAASVLLFIMMIMTFMLIDGKKITPQRGV